MRILLIFAIVQVADFSNKYLRVFFLILRFYRPRYTCIPKEFIIFL